MNSKIITNGSIQLYTEYFGDSNKPLVFLIMGATAQGVMWHEEFCNAIANCGYCVVRFDQRDTGKSTRINYEKSPYLLHDLANDLVAIIKAYSPNKPVHLVGASMGSFVAQSIALSNPDLLATLTCIMSSPKHTIFVDGFLGNDISHHPLPASNPKILQFYQEILSISTKDIDEDKKIHQEIWHNIADENEKHNNLDTRIFEGKILKRLKNKHYIHNHSYALANSKDLFDELKNITTPTLVLHGTDDYVLPFEHGLMLAEMIPNSKFIPINNMGHCLPLKESLNIIHTLCNHFSNQLNKL